MRLSAINGEIKKITVMRNQMEPPCVQSRPRKTSSRATSLGGKHLDAAIPDVTQESLFQLQNSQVGGLCTSGS